MKTLTGQVKSTKMTNTVVVEVTSFYQHPVYKKRVKKSKRFMAHNTLDLLVGDTVTMVETRPISKLKRWNITKLVSRPSIAPTEAKPVIKKTKKTTKTPKSKIKNLKSK